jgi:hypothetical protein
MAAPRATFAYLRDHGGRSWLWPLLAALGLTVAARMVAMPIERAQAEAALAELQAQLGDQPGSGPGDFTVGVPVGAVPIGRVGTGAPAAHPVVDYGLAALGAVWDWALRGGVLLGLAWVLGGRPSAGAMLRMSAWTLVPNIARLGVMLAVMLATGTVPPRGLSGLDAAPAGAVLATADSAATDGGDGADEGSGPVVTFQPGPGSAPIGPGAAPGLAAMFAGTWVANFLSALDIYSLWALALLAIGAAVTARLGWLRASLATLAYWGVSLSLATLPPLLSFWLLRLSGVGMP